MGIGDLFAASSEEPTRPGLVLITHVTAKTVELGATLGLGLGMLIGLVDYGTKRRSPMVRVLEVCEVGVSLGCLFGFTLVLGKASNDETMNLDGIFDRGYRLTHSTPGIKYKMDIHFLLGGVLGSFVFGSMVPEKWMGGMSWLDRITRGYCVGGALAALPFTLKVMQKMAKKKLEM